MSPSVTVEKVAVDETDSVRHHFDCTASNSLSEPVATALDRLTVRSYDRLTLFSDDDMKTQEAVYDINNRKHNIMLEVCTIYGLTM